MLIYLAIYLFFHVNYISVIPRSWSITDGLPTDMGAHSGGPMGFTHIAVSSVIDRRYPKNTRSIIRPFSYSDWHHMGRIIKY